MVFLMIVAMPSHDRDDLDTELFGHLFAGGAWVYRKNVSGAPYPHYQDCLDVSLVALYQTRLGMESSALAVLLTEEFVPVPEHIAGAAQDIAFLIERDCANAVVAWRVDRSLDQGLRQRRIFSDYYHVIRLFAS